MSTSLTVIDEDRAPPAVIAASREARHAILQFFEAELRSKNTRRAYMLAAEDFLLYAAGIPGGDRLETITSLHVSSWLGHMEREGQATPTIKQRLAAVRHLFQSLAREHIVRINPAAVVNGPSYSVKRGKTPVLTAEEARVLLDAIDDTTLVGLRDRAMIATMVYTFARIGAVIALREKDVFHQQRRLWLRLSEKGGKQQQVPCHHNLEAYLDEYMAAAQLGDGATAPLFQTLQRAGPRIAIVRGADGQQEKRSIWQLSGKPMSQPIAWAMVRRRAADAGLDTAVCNHTFRATGITTYLKNGGTIERAAAIANHTSTRTTQLYDRRPDDVALDEIEKIQI